jgi:hypothetical protein
MAKTEDLALGSYEAAALMGVHFTRPRRMFDDGTIDGRRLDPVWVASSPRDTLIYSSAACEKNYADYEEAQAKRNRGCRPRAWLSERPKAQRLLRSLTVRISYDDAIGTAEAAKILGVHHTLIRKLVVDGKLVARQAWNPRHSVGRFYIISRKSCEQNRKDYAAGVGRHGTPRGYKRK